MKLTNIINEVRYPPTVDGLTMGFLYAGLKGQEALSYFLRVALKEFNTDAPFISALFKRYRLKERDYR